MEDFQKYKNRFQKKISNHYTCIVILMLEMREKWNFTFKNEMFNLMWCIQIGSIKNEKICMVNYAITTIPKGEDPTSGIRIAASRTWQKHFL